jgi:ribosomal protein S27AE
MRFFRRRPGHRAPSHELTFCASCASDFVSPTDWAAHDDASWWIRLRCGECGEVREVVVPQETASRYDLALNRTTEVIASTLQRLDRERMTAEIEAFSTALERDLIDASDFARAR